MLLTDTGLQLVEHLERQKDIPSLLASFQKLVQAFGLTSFCIGSLSNTRIKRPNRRWDGNWSIDWELHYAAHDYLSEDPLVEQMQRAPRPFRWSSVFVRADAGRRRVLEDASSFGLKEGICIPIHGPAGPTAGLSLATGDYDLAPRDERALEMASLYLHARMAVLRAECTAGVARSLAPRERECLEWVAAGKTDWEISEILDISEQTVHGYIQNALAKLDARTRAQAVALAMQASQIQP
jgi:LuxR family quorum sensing-dependent transcriptional regulator